MARHIHRGDAVARPDIFRVDLKTVIPGGRYGLKFWNRPLASVIATEEDQIEALTSRLMQAVRDLSVNAYPDTENTSSFLVEGEPGEAMGPAIDSSPGCYVEVLRAGVATTSQVFRIIMPKGASGGTWYMTIVTPAGTSLATYPLGSAFAYNIDESTLGTAIEFVLNEYGSYTGTGVAVKLVNPGSSTQSRIYEVTMGGVFSGHNFAVTAEGGALQGTATVTATTVQLAGDKATAIQAIWWNLLPNYNNGRNQVVKFSRGGVTSAEVPVGTTISQSAVEEAIAQVVGANKVTVRLGTNGANIAVVLKWNELGDQGTVTASSYDKGNSSPGIPAVCQTVVVRASGANQNEILLASVGQSSGVVDGVTQTQPSNYEVHQGATTWTITHSYSSTAANLVTQWEAGVGAGNVSIYSLAKFNNMYLVEFKGAKSNLDQEPVTFTTAGGRSFTVVSEGEPLKNQIDKVVIRADGGTFTTSSNGTNFTSALAYNLTNSTFQTSLRGLAAIGSGNCNVTGSGSEADPFLVEYVGAKASTPMPLLVFNTTSLLGGYDPEITLVTAPHPGVRQYDKIYIDVNAISGTVTPFVGGIVGKAVAYNGNAGAWETGIEGSGVGVAVTGSVGGPFFVEYDAAGPRKLTLEQSLLGVSESTLITLTQVQEATGPLHYNEPLNWSNGVVPGSDDTLVFVDGSASIQEGLRQRCTFTAEISTGDFRLGTNVNDCGDFAVGQKVRITTTGTFPTATINGVSHTLSAATDYYVIAIDRFRRRMQLATSRSGVGIELTGAGTGTHTVSVRWAKIEQRRSHSGRIGRSRRNGSSWEDRPRYLKGEAALVEIGVGESGLGTSLCFLDLGTFPFTCTLWESGNGRDGEQAIQIRCNNTQDDVYPRGGQIGIGTDEEHCVMGDLVGQGADVTLGLVSLTSIDLVGGVHSFPQGITVSGSIRII